ncbi:MAG TPA: PEGA domain-containing protein [Candidatus Saccharimonadales bacterium]|jgi:hypothetical protein|nr:PEGA domain-containing protein [Candidatus Saccharimonadales bacterium]
MDALQFSPVSDDDRVPIPTPQDRYAIQSELGRGAMAVVYKAHDRLIGRTVALKSIRLDSGNAGHKAHADQLLMEAKAAGSLDHPNIVTIYDIVLDKGFVYLSMQFLEGTTLNELLENDHLPPLPELLSYADQICQAVGFAHQRGVIHRDLKPANLMLTGQGVIKILDFGIAQLGDREPRPEGGISGTPSYMSPEQAAGKEMDHRSDIFSLGSVFYGMFTGFKPFTGEVNDVLQQVMSKAPIKPSSLKPSLPPGIEAIILRALEKDPLKRFQDCGAMAAAFRQQAKLLNEVPQIAIKQPSVWPAPATTAETTHSPLAAGQTAAPQTVHGQAPAKRPSVGAKYWKLGAMAATCLLVAGALAAVIQRRAAAPHSVATSQPPQPTVVQPAVLLEPAKPTITETTETVAPQPKTGKAPSTARKVVSATVAAAVEGELAISSTPPGATVEVEGQSGQSWKTPQTIAHLAPASYKVTLRKSGYAPETRVIQVSGGNRASFDVQLKATQGFLSVTSTPPGATILIGGTDTGKVTPAEFMLNPAAQHIILRKEGYLEEQTEIKLTAGQTANYSPLMRAAGRTDNIKAVGGFSKLFGGGPGAGTAQIEIKTQPKGAQVVINGKPLGKITPVVIQVEMGNYDISLEKEGYKPVHKSVNVSTQGKTKIEETLSK